VLVCATHFPSPSFGHIVPKGNTFHFRYVVLQRDFNMV
jgi:hypothetical protein